MTDLRKALAQPEQEPVAWRNVAGKTTCYYEYNEEGKGEPLYTAPPKREWVGLTGEEVTALVKGLRFVPVERDYIMAEMIEAKLKEKNV